MSNSATIIESERKRDLARRLAIMFEWDLTSITATARTVGRQFEGRGIAVCGAILWQARTTPDQMFKGLTNRNRSNISCTHNVRVSFQTGFKDERIVFVFFFTLSESGISFIFTYGSDDPFGSIGMRFLPCRTAKENIDTSASLCYVASFPSQHGAK